MSIIIFIYQEKRRVNIILYSGKNAIDENIDGTIFITFLDESEKYVRAYRVKNKSTNSQMLYFASDIKNLKIQVNNQPVPQMDCGNKTGEFNVYGVFEKGELNKSVNINGIDYPLIETELKNIFIGKSEI